MSDGGGNGGGERAGERMCEHTSRVTGRGERARRADDAERVSAGIAKGEMASTGQGHVSD